MRTLTEQDARHAVLGGGVLACGGGGWKDHGELMGRLATSVGTPVLADCTELPDDAWVATVTAIGAPAAADWEIQPADYVHALQALMDAVDTPITAVMTAQNGYSTTLNGWIQSAMLGVAVLDAAGDIRAHPTGKLGSLGLTSRKGYLSTQVVCGGNRELHGHLLSINKGTVETCDDVLRDISVRSGGFIAAARNPVELDWVKRHAALGAVSLALELGVAMESAIGERGPNGTTTGQAVAEAVADKLNARVLARGELAHERELLTSGGFDHGTFRIDDCTVQYLNEFMTVDGGGTRLASYPDTITILDGHTGLPLAVKDATAGMDVVLLASSATNLPLSSSAVDEFAVAECERIMDTELVRYLPQRSTA
jgi:hypothetical protein